MWIIYVARLYWKTKKRNGAGSAPKRNTQKLHERKGNSERTHLRTWSGAPKVSYTAAVAGEHATEEVCSNGARTSKGRWNARARHHRKVGRSKATIGRNRKRTPDPTPQLVWIWYEFATSMISNRSMKCNASSRFNFRLQFVSKSSPFLRPRQINPRISWNSRNWEKLTNANYVDFNRIPKP